MAETLMRHPVHGFKHAYMEAEIAMDMANGWIVVIPEVPRETMEEAKCPPKKDEPRVKRKPGRPRKM